MPEGDSYTRAARRVTPVLVGRRITAVEGSSPDVRRRSRALLDSEVSDVRTLGKHLLIDLDSGLSIHLHLGMSGAIRVGPAGRGAGKDGGAVRLALSTDRGTMWVLGAPTVKVDRREVIERGLDHLGPDLLAADFDWYRFETMAGRYPGDRSASEFLLDQRVMAGIGNAYKSEVLFLERVAPDRPMEKVDMADRFSLAKRARRLMLPNAHRVPRSTTGRPSGDLWVYGRTGRPCRRCRTAVAEGWVGDPPRITYWCPTCQK